MTHQLLHDNMGFGANVLSVFQARRGSSVAWVKTPAKWVQYFAGVWAGRQLFHEIYDRNPRSCQTSPWSQAALYPKHSTEEGEACSKESSFHKKREKAFRSPRACGLVGILLRLPPGPANDVRSVLRTPAADTLLRALLEVKGLRPTEAEPAFGQAPCGRVVGTSSRERHCPVAAFL